jgi:hypothetical protein
MSATNRINKPVENVFDFEGRFTGVDTTERDIWELGATQDITLPSSAGVVSVVSSSLNDDEGNTGIEKLEILGLNENHEPIQETVTLDGTTPALSTQSFFRINFLRSKQVGSNNSAVGNIDASIGGNIQARIAIGYNNSQKTQGTVPRDVIISRIFWQSFRGNSVIVRFKRKPTSSNFWQIIREVEVKDAHVVAEIGAKVPIGTDIKVTAQAVTGTATITAGYNIA